MPRGVRNTPILPATVGPTASDAGAEARQPGLQPNPQPALQSAIDSVKTGRPPTKTADGRLLREVRGEAAAKVKAAGTAIKDHGKKEKEHTVEALARSTAYANAARQDALARGADLINGVKGNKHTGADTALDALKAHLAGRKDLAAQRKTLEKALADAEKELSKL